MNCEHVNIFLGTDNETLCTGLLTKCSGEQLVNNSAPPMKSEFREARGKLYSPAQRGKNPDGEEVFI